MAKDTNKHITEYLDFYCKFPNPKFAVMLDGEWGCGKTWFIENYIQNNKDKFLYISLNGKRFLSDIETDFFEKLHPILSSKPAKFAGIIFKSAIKLGFKVDLNKDGTTDAEMLIPKVNINDFIGNSTSKILIFDDLERCNIEIESVLGYINQFVEHLELNVIIVGNTEELPEEKDKKEKYFCIKEKLIGKTLKIQPNDEEGINSFISEFEEDQNILNIYKENKELLLKIFQQSDYKNLRLLRYALIDFERLFSKIDNKYLHEKEFIQELLLWFLIISIEHNQGNFSAEKISGFEKQVGVLNVKNVLKDDTTTMDWIEDTFNKYNILISEVNNRFLTLSLWEEFIIEGHIDKDKAYEAFDNTKHFIPNNRPTWMKLWHRNLSDVEFDNEMKNLNEELEEKKYVGEAEILHVFGLLLYFSNKGLYQKSIKDIQEFFENYVSNLIIENKFESIKENYYRYDSAYGLGYCENKTTEFKDFITYLKDSKKQQTKINIKKEIDNLTINNFLGFIENISNPNNSTDEFFQVAVLNLVDVEKFKHLLNSIEPIIRADITNYISSRYDFMNSFPLIKNEIEFLNKFKNLAKDEMQNLRGKRSYLVWERDVSVIQKILDRIEDNTEGNSDVKS